MMCHTKAKISLLVALWALTSALPAAYAEIMERQTLPPKAILQIITPPLEKSSQKHNVYFLKLLDLALQKTEGTDGPYNIQQFHEILTINRFSKELERDTGMINVMWLMADKSNGQHLLPIKISLLRDLNSYRIFLIRKEDQEKFHKIKTLDDLSYFTAGQGAHWPDTAVMLRNKLPVITSAHYELLFTMLANKRFDYFPRGLYEIWNEQQANQDKQLVVEDSLILHYPAPIYFFVNEKNVSLANRIERGLHIAIEDGSFDRLFFSIPGFKQGTEEMQKNSRHRFELTTDNF